ncbi:MAG: DUF4124 domain-containing protein, partial [Gammaproteobacteria bacterium]|nr:DUF4124 domain-containing protein [Gammaproteobacteria bacterium]
MLLRRIVKPGWSRLTALALVLTAVPASAEIYKYIDREGNVYFTNLPYKRSAGF